ncbi:hypothetical protein COU15_01555 [Candidatus Kaiserbacteria bacterium CG10_big_fil_rev_8_21_14_0_10_45_20]|uniref:Anticodon-binding domain-containing protein n=1 Tax=Candidatus Kaiserbacteria bacterium CG10_big_fil_rev_8_21_14_0_10_45_20 TaxID=1974607 RepID=A0A2H0UFV2_9BACT|nr:MAG: hypothetical protein COU15_01555 [Candidatus Kaiserbacteria bacterium CG10_big_fil_rev_8_21_14_0_10_45_20]
MRSIERGVQHESLEAVVGSIASAYGFVDTPVALSNKTPQQQTPTDTDKTTSDIAVLADTLIAAKEVTQSWGISRHGTSSTVVFAITSPKHAIAQAFVVKASLAVVESAGFSDATVLISSIGDQESRRRFNRELGNFFKKNAKAIPEHIVDTAQKSPEDAMKLLVDEEHELVDSLPRSIDFLSESSRKIMLETISLFESLNITYELAPRLDATAGVHNEILFAIEASDKKGERVRLAMGGRFDEYTKKKGDATEIVGMGVSVPEKIDSRIARSSVDTPACFVVHIGEAAKIKAFGLLDSLLRSRIALGQAILASTMQEQMELAKSSGAKYVSVIGHREALDDTVILRNLTTQIQEVIPIQKLPARMSRVRV